ncbi:MAG: DAK2 domain-containing protein [Lachnospiraceae bacterium]|nr:DAK2 domain-containing protein [Lachnospiraceae bacterium]
MLMKTVDAPMAAKLFLGGAKNLEAKKEWINELNVFPVPDGDTGTNMTMTIMSAVSEVSSLADMNMYALAKAISSGSLRGARGNSGVILSQLFRGFTRAIQNQEELDVVDIANAMQKAVETAYKAVMKPKEGTILTVARGAADKAAELAETEEDIVEFARLVIEEAEAILEKTPQMLPVLKEAGVVDSGGQGLVEVLKGMYDVLLGKEVDYSASGASGAKPVKISAETEADIKFGYCTEFLIMLPEPVSVQREQEFKAYLESIGDSIVVVADDEIIKVHVHTNAPGLAIQRALTYGPLSNMKIDNMRLEHEERLIKDASKIAAQQKAEKEAAQPAERKDMGFIAVSVGAGMGEIFRELGVDHLIEGGQTMNPSTEDILEAVEQVNADNIFILPNNKNIILAANQASSLVKDKNVIVVPTKTVPQGITAMVSFEPDATPQENAQSMEAQIKNVKTGEVTYAVRDTVVDHMEIHEGNIMGIGDEGILAVGSDVAGTAHEMLKKLVDESSEIVGIYYGEDVSDEAARAFGDEIAAAYPNVEVEVHAGGQPIYYYIVSVE